MSAWSRTRSSPRVRGFCYLMGDRSAIEWTDATWNPVAGCSKVSPGCAHCYAEAFSLRFGRSAGPWTSANAPENVVLHPGRLDQPLRWRRPRMVFVNSMSDLFHEQVPDEFIARVFATMAAAPQHIFQVLTKRPERMRDWVSTVATCEHGWLTHNGDNPTSYGGTGEVIPDCNGWPLPNVWLGVSIENRRFVSRADVLRETGAAVRFISAEPLLGPLLNPGERHAYDESLGSDEWPDGYIGLELDLTGIDWLIAGGESGPQHRPIRAGWVRDLRDEASWRGTAFFFKQWGGRTPKAGGRELDGRTWDEMPAFVGGGVR